MDEGTSKSKEDNLTDMNELQQQRDTATTLNNLTLLYYSQGKYKEAEPLYQQSLDITKRILGEENPDTADVIYIFAELHRKM